ncbi:very short patch repair endonuclease [uncultured Roseibium sp.]|uniref:very short patch repair endonuclease n=1 Tax=uncultured Roseibium sp. TaxID=1936171 RepID=UPI002636B896|nr:very short patch repair endonuclease [uncultured Roseibium sp.]
MDRITSSQRSANMREIKSKSTKPEMVVRQLVHHMGYRYRLHRKDLPGKPDLVFGPRRKVIFVHGCFWHQHPDPTCKSSHAPRSRLDYWQPKLLRNQQRDKANIEALRAANWKVLVIWECETKLKCPDKLVAVITDFLGRRETSSAYPE